MLPAPSILNSISWSSHLDKTFKQNNGSSLTWQFFCSEDAHLRIYPGNLEFFDDSFISARTYSVVLFADDFFKILIFF